MKFCLQCLILMSSYLLNAQAYDSYMIGDASNASTTPTYGLCLMGGASEHDNAMSWLLNKADGGDIVVLRTSGGDAYNDYMFNQLGVNVNSVETIVIHNINGATSDYVLNRVSQAEMIWLAGGDQWNYVDFFKDTALEDLINDHINQKQAPIGGTSAGMAVLSNHYFDAQNGTVTSDDALMQPFNSNISIGHNDFLDIPFMQNTITDTHYDNPDRKGRHSVFLAKVAQQIGDYAFGIAADEFTAICVDQNGVANVYGEYPNFDDFAYFLQVNCENTNFLPENLSTGEPITWNRSQKAIKVYKVPGTPNGSNNFDIDSWATGNGGSWENWWIQDGNFNQDDANAVNCNLSYRDIQKDKIKIYPNPAKDFIRLESDLPVNLMKIYDLKGRLVHTSSQLDQNNLSISFLAKGVYLMKVKTENQQQVIQLIKR
ncbi:MAG: T9SS type A sorting domain-containing protein [Psychroflexus sp.]|nr:T9SS type A sorting domain-containing protein [Psychroflexus sp.]